MSKDIDKAVSIRFYNAILNTFRLVLVYLRIFLQFFDVLLCVYTMNVVGYQR
jgi:hypothetical protein